MDWTISINYYAYHRYDIDNSVNFEYNLRGDNSTGIRSIPTGKIVFTIISAIKFAKSKCNCSKRLTKKKCLKKHPNFNTNVDNHNCYDDDR